MKSGDVPPAEVGVDARVNAAKRAANQADAAVAAVSAARLAVLKALPPSRLARLGPDKDLTEADNRELRQWIADRMTNVGAKPGKLKRNTSRRARSWGSVAIVSRWRIAALFAVVVAVLLVTAHVRTPARFQVLQRDTAVTLVDLDGSARQVILPSGTVVVRDGGHLQQRLLEARIWVPARGYQPVMIAVDR